MRDALAPICSKVFECQRLATNEAAGLRHVTLKLADIHEVEALVIGELLESDADQFAAMAGATDTAKGEIRFSLGRLSDTVG